MENWKILVVGGMEGSGQITPFIKKLGHNVCGIAGSIEDATVMIRVKQPDLVIIDSGAAGATGCTGLGCQLREQYRIPFIYMATHADTQNIGDLIKAHPSAFIVKPVNEDEMKFAIRVAMQKTG